MQNCRSGSCSTWVAVFSNAYARAGHATRRSKQLSVLRRRWHIIPPRPINCSDGSAANRTTYLGLGGLAAQLFPLGCRAVPRYMLFWNNNACMMLSRHHMASWPNCPRTRTRRAPRPNCRPARSGSRRHRSDPSPIQRPAGPGQPHGDLFVSWNGRGASQWGRSRPMFKLWSLWTVRCTSKLNVCYQIEPEHRDAGNLCF